ncbi:hypothetical protein [Hansschlegelia zhihuaiae]|uniref:Uncharacterized protein n=1 Tax=Hansschlegelia zhihuaiae TaxID=405005 RepID=A0A4Q0MI79_9HYPH|nr:hypothetical protein [Hansschlegelia zhihuaiae]RXF73331.1 hypothetical protein EK403_10925 [Hansschlegelia zhihuaiae]
MGLAPHGRGWPHYVAGVALNTALFTAVGPMIGVLLFGGLLVAPLLQFFLVFGYAVAAAPAALTGAATAILSSFVRSEPALYAATAAIGAPSSASMISLPGWRGPTAMVIIGCVGAVSAVACARLARSLRLRPRNGLIEPPNETLTDH